MAMTFPERLQDGSVLDEYYEVQGFLGSGGFADVYKGVQRDTGMPIAIKVLRPVEDEKIRESFTRRFMQEARIAARLKHPNVVTVLACRSTMGLRSPSGESASFNRCYIVMEELQGRDLETELSIHGAMAPERALKLMVGCLDGLAEGHALGIVHKDLKPANLFLVKPGRRSERLKILDYGIARVGQTKVEKITQTGQAVFTPQYAAPEYLESLIATPALDVYQMALILAEMLTGQTVVEGDTVFQCMLAHTKGIKLAPSLVRPPLGEVLGKALALDHTARYEDASAFCVALEAINPAEVPSTLSDSVRLVPLEPDTGPLPPKETGPAPLPGVEDPAPDEEVPQKEAVLIAAEPPVAIAAEPPPSPERQRPRVPTVREELLSEAPQPPPSAGQPAEGGGGMAVGAVVGIIAALCLMCVMGSVAVGLILADEAEKAQEAAKVAEVREDVAAKAEDKEKAAAPGAINIGVGSGVLPISGSAMKGNPNAPVTIVVFSEFQCPFCSRALPTMAQILREYPDEVRLVFKHNPLSFHKDAPLAAEAALAAGQQGVFWEMHDKLFENQKALGRADLERYARELQLDMDKFRAALDGGTFKARIKDDQALAAEVGARGTPNFFINGIKVIGAKPFDEFKKVIDGELAVVRGKGAEVYAQRVLANFTKEAPKVPSDKPKQEEDTRVYEIDTSRAPFKGPADASVHIVEFSEFQCPFCSRVVPTLDKIMRDYPGRVRISFMHVPLPFHKDAPLAAEAAMAAHTQGKFWEMHDVLFANQKALGRSDLERYARGLGLNMSKFNRDLDASLYRGHVERDKAQAGKVGASGTPTFFINGRKFVGAQPYERFKEKIDEALGR